MSDYLICLDRNNQIICWGDMYSCSRYVNQMYSITENDIRYEEYSISSIYSSSYEDYEVFNIEGTNIYLTLGEIKLVREGCQDGTRSIKFIQDELNSLMNLTNIYSKSIIEELQYFHNFMNELIEINTKYNMDNLFTNLDIDALHIAYQMERENQGLPTMFIK